jgi:hypothetical protein
MIEIKNGRIYFYNKYKPTLKVLDFKCLSAYVCPECKNVLRAYFIGHVMEESIREYIENDKMKYAYQAGNSEGGQWISMNSHTHKEQCRWEVLGSLARGAEHSVEAFTKIHDVKLKRKAELIEALDKEILPGFKKIRDEMGKDLPIFIFNQDALIEAKGLDFDKKWERMTHMGIFIDSKLLELKRESKKKGG